MDGVIRRVRFDEAMEVNILSSRRRVAPYGIEGGHDGATGRNLVIRADGTTEEFGHTVQTSVDVGDAIEIHTPGGGGYGVPT